jgi:glycosyltransferase involved in cell wall biosynthesis
VTFPGGVTDIAELLATAQAFTLASDHEGFPLSVLEAMRAGLPIIASDLPGIREQLQDGKHGLLVNHHDESALSAAFERLASEPALRASLGRAARQRWEQHFGLKRMADATWAIYLATLPTPPRATRVPT